MRYLVNYILVAFLGMSFLFSGCEASDFEFDSGWDDNAADSSRVTVDTVQGIDVSMYEKARLFPELVDTASERRIADTVVYLDLSRKYIQLGIMQEGPQSIYSSGLYAGAGELVTVYVPDNVWGLTVQVGMHTEDLTNDNIGLREPIAYYRKALYPGKNTVRFSLGGYLWVLRDQDVEGDADVPLTFCNVYAAPDFVFGKTDVREWEQKVKATTVPWLELRGKNVAFSVERSQLDLYFSQRPDFAMEMEACLATWDEMLETIYRTQGFDKESDAANPQPMFPNRFVFDVQLRENKSRRSDNEQGMMLVRTASLYDDLLNIDSVADLHFINVYSMVAEKYSYFYNGVTGWEDEYFYVPLYRMNERNKEIGLEQELSDMGIDFKSTVPVALSYAEADTSKWMSSDLYTAKEEANRKKSLYLLPRVQIAEYENHYQDKPKWDIYDKLSHDRRAGNDYEGFFRELCDRYQVDFTPFYEHWGMFVSGSEREYASRYPLLDKQIWKINPLAEDPFEDVGQYETSSFRYRANRSAWKIAAWDSEGRENEDKEYKSESDWKTADNLLDGDPYSYWSSYLSPWSGGYQDSPSELPYYVVIDMGKEQVMDGFYYANGDARCISGFTLQTTDASGFGLEQHGEQEWSTVYVLEQTVDGLLKNEQFIDFPQPVTARYLRLVFDKPNLFIPNEGDEENFENFHKDRQQMFSEFGTFFYKR